MQWLHSLPTGNRARGHLIAFVLNGNNKSLQNFAALYSKANYWMKSKMEMPLRDVIKAGGYEWVNVTPVYGNATSPVPTSIIYNAFGSLNRSCVIENNATAAGSWCI